MVSHGHPPPAPGFRWLTALSSERERSCTQLVYVIRSPHFFPHDLPARNRRIIFLNIAKDQAATLKHKRANLA